MAGYAMNINYVLTPKGWNYCRKHNKRNRTLNIDIPAVTGIQNKLLRG
jgi:hypothetical protein